MTLEPTKTYNVQLTGEEIGLIQSALAEIPYKFAAGLIHALPNKITEVEEKAENPDDKKVRRTKNLLDTHE